MIYFDPGNTIDEFEIISLLGEGGMGRVYLARQRGLERLVALKFLNTSLSGEDHQKIRFQREALVLSKLKHKNLVTLYAYGQWKGKFPYLVMEFLSGASLENLLRQEGPLEPLRAISILLSICSGIEYAHSNGIVHRDLKPSNVILEGDSPEEVKIIDFGLARLESAQELTKSGALIGSYHYMSPEQCAGLKSDERSDLYALGCILFELLTGAPPFVADTATALMRKHCCDELPPLCASVPLPIGLEGIVSKLLSKQPGDRYQTAAELQADLKLVALGNGGQIDFRINRVQKSSTLLLIIISLAAPFLILFVPLAVWQYQDKQDVVAKNAREEIRPKSVRADLRRLYGVYLDRPTPEQIELALSQCEQDLARIPKDERSLVVQGYELYGLLCKKASYLKPEKAQLWLTRSLKAFNHALGLVRGEKLLAESGIRTNIAQILQEKGDLKSGYRELERALHIATERQPTVNFPMDPNLPGAPSEPEISSMMTALSIGAAQSGNFALANQWLVKCKIECERIGEPNRSLEAVPSICLALLKAGRQKDAQGIFKHAEQTLDEGLAHATISTKEAVSTYAALSSVPLAMLDLKNCVRLLKRGVGCLSSTDDSLTFKNLDIRLEEAAQKAHQLKDEKACSDLVSMKQSVQRLRMQK